MSATEPTLATERATRLPARHRWLSPVAWRLAWTALVRVVWVRVALWRWPYGRVRARLLVPRSRRASRIDGRVAATTCEPKALAWAVGAAARRVPKASCLTQALALEALMLDVGLAPALRIGVARGEDGSFEAHAWVEYEGDVLIGHLADLERYAVLPPGVGPQGRP